MATLLNKEKNRIEFDPHDWKGMHDLMDRHKEFTSQYFGENEEGERVSISVNKDNITVVTFQSNGWTRENIYHRDYDVEELYHKGWPEKEKAV